MIVFIFFSAITAESNSKLQLEEILSLLENNTEEEEIIKQIKVCKVDFEIERNALRKLISAGASDSLLDVISENIVDGLRIISPSEGEKTGKSVIVEGKVEKNRKEKHLWVFAHRKNIQGWWPQLGEIPVDSKQKSWKQTAFLGTKHDIGHDFEIKVIWLNQTNHEKMQRYMEKADYHGIPLPDGEPSAMVTVKKTDHK